MDGYELGVFDCTKNKTHWYKSALQVANLWEKKRQGERERERDREKSDGDAIKICPIFLN